MNEFEDYIQSPIYSSIIELELGRSFPYYKLLTPALQNRFAERTAHFISKKKFVGRQQLTITDQIRILVSACAVQVTFGFDTYTLDHYEYVILFPDVYQSPVTKLMHKGETNLNGFICLSWKHILEGIENPDDNYNLGLHEWMHAVRFNSIHYEQTDYFFDGYINKWVASAMPEYNSLRSGKPSIFRRYGATNIHEFLSVSIEHFFESPDEFREKVPLLFDQTCILLNQIPSKKGSAVINVRPALMKIDTVYNISEPQLSLEASFFLTLFNFGTRLFYFGITLLVLLMNGNIGSYLLVTFLVMIGIVLMNNEFFTLQLYDEYIYLQKGFLRPLASKFKVNYHSLINVNIYEGTYGSNMGTVFELNYYDGSKFIKRAVYCSAIHIPKEKITALLLKKNVSVFFL